MVDLRIPESKIAFHLADRALTPLISSSPQSQPAISTTSQPESQMQALTTVAITAYDSASRLGLGLPQRIMIESRNRGPVILHSYLHPPSSHRSLRNGNGKSIIEQAREELRPLSSGADTERSVAGEEEDSSDIVANGIHYEDGLEDEADMEGDGSSAQRPPLLIATVVVTSAADTGEARQAAAKLERLGRDFQQEWKRGQLEQNEAVEAAGEEGDG